MSIFTAIRSPKPVEVITDLPSVEELQAHYDLPAYKAAPKTERKMAFRDIGYAKVGANAVRKYLPKLLAERGIQDAEARQSANLLADRIQDSGRTFQGLNDTVQLAVAPAKKSDYEWEKYSLQGQDITDTLEAMDAMVAQEAPAREHAGTYAGSLALHMLETMPREGEQIMLGR